MPQHVKIELNRFNIRRLRSSSALKLVKKVVRDVEVLAKLESRGPYSTGRTAASITGRAYLVGSDARGEVTAHTPYSHIAHNGARPHKIPLARRRPGELQLRFYWRKVGRVVTFSQVSHPGMQGKHFLSGPMERVGRGKRFMTFTFD